MKKIYLLGIAFAICTTFYSQSVFINEIHYDNSGVDVFEGVEIAGPYSTDLTGYSIVLYNGGNSSVYSTIPLLGTIPSNQNYRGVVWFDIPDIQNGAPDGIALIDPLGNVVQFLSYEGVITAADGPAIGLTSTNISVSESGSETDESLQLTGSGTEYTDFTWAVSGTATRGNKNTGQTFTEEPFIVSNGTISDLNYELGLGPSIEGSLVVSGYNLTDDINISAPTNFEISLTSGGVFGASLVLSESLGIVNTTAIYVKLKASLPVANYIENLTLSTAVASSQIISISGSVFQTNSLVITGVYDGPLFGGTPKGIEVYVINDIADLSVYGIGIANNGEGTDGEEFTFPNISIVKGTYIYLSKESSYFISFFGFTPDYTDITFGINGDDSVELFENGIVIDVFGDINTDGSGEPWEYLDGWAYRNTAGPNTTFTVSEWDYSGVGNLTGGATNAATTTPFPIGTYAASVLSVVKNDIEGFTMYPNPVSNGLLYMTSSNTTNKKIEIYSLIGQHVFSKKAQTNEPINISNLNRGIYFVRIEEEGKIATRKLIVE